MKRIYIIIFTVILLFGSTLTLHAEESSFEDAHSLVSYWIENNLTPDYFCGCWYENGNEDCLIVAVKETEEGELGKQEIIDLIEDDSSVRFVYQVYGFNEMENAIDELFLYFNNELEVSLTYCQTAVKENRVYFGIAKSSLNGKLGVRSKINSIKRKYGDMVIIEYTDKNYAIQEQGGNSLLTTPFYNYGLYFFLFMIMLLTIVGFKRRQLVAKYINGRDIVRNNRLSKREIENFVKMNTSVSISKEVDDRILNGLNHLEIRIDENKKTTKKKTFFVKTVLAVSVFGVLIGGIIHNYRNGEPVSDASSSSYAYRSLEEMVDEATYIFEGRVVKVQENRNRRTLGIHRDQNGKLRIVIHEYYVTPIKLEVKQDIKGNIWKKTFTYYKEVSLSENQNALLKGSVVKEGMEFILFLDKDRYDFGGGQGISMVFGDKVSASCLYDYLDAPESVFEVMDVDEIDSTVWDVRGMREISVVNKEYYISVIQSVMNDKESNKPKEIVGNMIFYFEPIEEAPSVNENEIWNVGCQGKELNQEKADKLRAILDSVDEWHDDSLIDRLAYYYDGEFIFIESEMKYYFSYDSNIIFYDHYFAEISTEDMEYIKSIDKR